MSDKMEVKLNDRALKQLIKAFGKTAPYAKVGVLGSTAGRSGGKGKNITNAQIGMFHEFGTEHHTGSVKRVKASGEETGGERMPARSWLRMPLTTQLKKFLKASGAFDEEALKKVIEEGSIREWVKRLGLVGEETVRAAFDTGGFGEWPKSDMRRKTNWQTLVESGQLKGAVTSEVKE